MTNPFRRYRQRREDRFVYKIEGILFQSMTADPDGWREIIDTLERTKAQIDRPVITDHDDGIGEGEFAAYEEMLRRSEQRRKTIEDQRPPTTSEG